MERNAIYKNRRWLHVRNEVLKLDHCECQMCLGKFGKSNKPPHITPAVLVHHIYLAEEYPDWKYSIWVNVNGKRERNLISLCNECHEIIHGRNKKAEKGHDFSNEERFD